MADDRAIASTSRLAHGARTVVVAFLLLTIVAGGFAFLVGTHFNRIESDWNLLGHKPTEKGLLLSRLHDKIGFGGMIHNFKNYVIRGDKKFRDMALADHTAASELLDHYETLGVNPDEGFAIGAVRESIDRYRANVEKADALLSSGATVSEVDRAVKVDDTAMISALATLRVTWRRSFDTGRGRMSDSVALGRTWSLGAQIAAGLFLALAFAMALWILRRERLLSQAVGLLEKDANRFQSIVNNSNDGILTASRHGRIETFNTAAEKIFGYTNDEAVGMDVSDLVPADLRDRHRVVLKEIAESAPGTINFPRLVHGRRKDGGPVPIEINIAHYEADHEIHYVATFRDITQRLNTENELRNLKEAAEEANNAKSYFLASMSHELRTPLNAVIGFSEMLQIGDLSEKQSEWTNHIHRAGTHLHELVSQILDLAQIEQGRLKVRQGPVEILTIVSDCLVQMQPIAVKRNVTLSNKLPNDAVLLVRGDATRIRQCVFNILTNAVKYNRENGSVTVTGQNMQDGYFRIAITDTGIGIAPEQHPYVFRMFQRFAEEPEMAREGAGIGLAITDQLIRMMGGRLTFLSELDKGSEFRIDLLLDPPPGLSGEDAGAAIPVAVNRSPNEDRR